MILYPTGYGSQMVTMADLRARHEPRMHPEFARRLFAWIEAQGGLVGIGGGFRALGSQPNKPGFAAEGRSFHQPQEWADHPGTYAAVDLVVVVPRAIHRAPRWQEVPNPGSTLAKLWGLHCNVYPSEAWHMQGVEYSGWRTWVMRGRKGLARHLLPGTALVPLVPLAPVPTLKKRPRLLQSLNNKAEVARLQNVCIWWGWHDDHNRPPLADGQFGALTEQAVKAMQQALRVDDDGEYGPVTARALQAFLVAMTAMAARSA